ncbi:MAG: hypothetical protein ACFFDW_14470 [Candidatus Thorarchaeota archaeon]
MTDKIDASREIITTKQVPAGSHENIKTDESSKIGILEDKKIIKFQDVDVDTLESDEAIGELFQKINPLTIPSIIIGIILLILYYTNVFAIYPIGKIFIGFAGGLAFVFGCSELIILGVKGIGKKLDWSEYFMGIIAAIGADSSDVIVVTLLITKAKALIATDNEGDIAYAESLTLISITYVLTTVLINTFVLGITMIVVSKKKPFKLPSELSQTEANLVLAMTVFSFILIAFGFSHNAIGIDSFDRFFEGIMGASLLLFYLLFILFLIGDAKKKRIKHVGPQTIISEYFPEDDEKEIEEIDLEVEKSNKIKQFFKLIFKRNGSNDENEQFIPLRRFPWYIILLSFAVGVAGIIFGGNLISNSIQDSIAIFDVPILVYCVVVGFVSSAPETTITLRALFNPEKENTRIGLIHQISSINQTYFILFGFPFLFASIINVAIPVDYNITLVFAGIFALSLALHLTIIDDNHFDRVEGTLILVTSIASLLALASVGGIFH